MPWDKPKPTQLVELRNKLEELKAALEDKRMEELNKFQTVLALCDRQLQEKIREVANARKVEQPEL